MMNLNADAMRWAMDRVRPTAKLDAQTLVEQTLRQHGLMPDGRFGSPAGTKTYPSAPATSRKRYTCAAGSREYVLHMPEGPANGVLMMLHGCTQTPDDFATGTDIVKTATQTGMIVVLPAQSRGDNAQSCWNWFSGTDQKRERGEPAILASLAGEIATKNNVPKGRTFVAGLSAGGAMAVILGQTYGDVFTAVGVHSGLPYGCARGVNEAFAAMGGNGSRPSQTKTATVIPTIVFHGTADHTVAPANGSRIINDVLDSASGQQTQIVNNGTEGGKAFNQTITLSDNGTPLTEHWEISGLGHAWSGGNPNGSYTDANGPDASAEMLRFFKAISQNEV
ncbi:alpha/beta hydrolase family esterase [Sulfitobacter noctilucae]|uniref:extracellular catalytic domain type 1 short-chain-length polyhydroxyalkanoate depolymerase n=1 Tax=Sulfitobacter noctilucae TaxID=1342302 RepID=UPI00056D57B4|nr:PHB depolymerase family esterase [Sulfitobacter noctilucae]